MKYYYLYIFLCGVILYAIIYPNQIHIYNYNYKENFDSHSNKKIILLGDSVFKNNGYVSDKQSIEDLLLERTNGESRCFAEDGANITKVYLQLKQLSNEVVDNNTTIFLSIGGNNILYKFIESMDINKTKNNLATIFTEYKSLVQHIKTTFPNANLVLVDLYYPTSIKYHPYYPIIDEWNKMLEKYTRENKYNLLQISYELVNDEDFVLNIEPSEIGGKKIVNSIIKHS